ncbi:hypothetical protein CO731_00283 [Aminobacter sp. MSH1]|nr:hypothetical protein CO731_00283 [Aminobacter sp. MSH1]
MHLAEYALRDFINLERLSKHSGVIVSDDVLPPTIEAAARERTTKVWTGDVYRIVPILREYRPDLNVQVYDVEMKGMCVVSGLNPKSTTLSDNLSKIEERLALAHWAYGSVEEIHRNLKPRSVGHFVTDIESIAAKAKVQQDRLQKAPSAKRVYREIRRFVRRVRNAASGSKPTVAPQVDVAPPVRPEQAKPAVQHVTIAIDTFGPSEQEAATVIRAADAFKSEFYARTHAGKIPGGMDPVEHYCRVGWKQGLQPTEWFVPAAYIDANPVLREKRANPLMHYLNLILSNGSKKSGTPNVGRVAVFTAIVGGYDSLKEPAIRPDNVDFFVFTEGNVPAESAWSKREIDYYHKDPVRTARFVKTHPHLYLQDYEWSVWTDGNLKLLVDPQDLISGLDTSQNMATWKHPLRMCIYDEAAECIRRNKDAAEIIDPQIARYRAASFPAKSELFETSVIVRRHMDQQVIDTMNEWWRETDNGSRRDQLGLPVAIQRTGLSVGHLAPSGICMRSDHRFAFAAHGK